MNCGLDHYTLPSDVAYTSTHSARLTQVTGDMRARGWGRSQEGQLGTVKSEEVDTPRGLRAVTVPVLLGVCRGDDGASVQVMVAFPSARDVCLGQFSLSDVSHTRSGSRSGRDALSSHHPASLQHGANRGF